MVATNLTSDAIRQTQAAVNPNYSVVLNLGLEGPLHGIGKLSMADRLSVYAQALSECMSFHSREVKEPVYIGDEHTLVVKGYFNENAPCSTLLWDMVCAAEQDCIAIYYPYPDYGYLYGPRCEGWGEFNKQYMKGIV
jgi:hypothetical protein